MDDPRLQAARREFDAWSALPEADLLHRVAACTDPELRALYVTWLATSARTSPSLAAIARTGTPQWLGQQIGCFRIDGVLGEGGMGLVFAATDTRDGREVAIKRVRPGLATPTLIRRLEREFELMQRIDHPGIVRPLALETDADGAPYLVLERVRGEVFSSAELTRSPRERVALIARAARLAGEAHAKGIVHRDIKPSNLMIGADDAVYLLDFGIAKPVAEEAMTALTQTGERMLTPRYAAPEQFRGEDVAASADVFALGTILLDSVPEADATRPREFPAAPREAAWLRAIAAQARDPQALRRYPDGRALADDLDRWLAGRAPRASRWHRRWRGGGAALIAAAVLALLVFVVAWQWQLGRRAEAIDSGLGLAVADLDGLSTTAADALRRALAADSAGDRPRAQELMRVADANSPTHPLPLLYLATWERGGGGNVLRARLDERLQRHADAYLGLLRDWLNSDGASPQQTERLLRAALDLRPGAWKLRLALAHQGLLRGDDVAARRELAAIEPELLDAKRATIVLGDRAMLGDAQQVEALIPALRQRDLLAANVVAATVALALAQCDQIVPGIDTLTTTATAAHRPDLAERAERVGLLCLGQLHRWGELLDAARRGLRVAEVARDEGGIPALAILGAIAATRLQQPDEAARLLARADGDGVHDGLRFDLALTRRMLGLPDPVLPQLLGQPGMAANDPALAAMSRAFIAYAENDNELARRELAAARRDGVRNTLFAIHADWLGRQLGEAEAADSKRLPMLWYPPTSRWAARW